MKNPRRAYRSDGTAYEPMTLAGLRDHGCRNVMVECRRCGRDASLNVDALDGSVPVPDVAIVLTKLVCSQCGARGEALNVRPDWSNRNAPGMGR